LQAPGLSSKDLPPAKKAEFPQSIWDPIEPNRKEWLSHRRELQAYPPTPSGRRRAVAKRAILFRPA